VTAERRLVVLSLALALAAPVIVLAVYEPARSYFVYLFIPAIVALMPLATERAMALVIATLLLVLFVVLELLTIGVFYMPAAAAMAAALTVRSRA
jgi:hypothetical protein